jgi:two-component system NtrC family sensor kinase
MFFNTHNLESSLFWGKILYFSASFIPPSFLLFSYFFPNIENRKDNLMNLLFFAPNLILFFLYFFTSSMLKGVLYINGIKSFAYGDLRILWDIQFNGLLIYGFIRYVKLFLKTNGVVREQLRYLLIGDLYIYIFAGTTNVILPLFSNFQFIWLGPIISIFWILLIFYTIVKYNLLDIKIVITRATIFILIYAIVLGIPFGIGIRYLGVGLWLLPTVLMAIFATVGPSVYLYIQKRAEDRLLQEQRRYQATLRQASAGMGKIKDLKKLLNMIVYVLTNAIQIEHALVYVFDEAHKRYVLGAIKRRSGQNKFVEYVEEPSPLIKYFLKNKIPVVFEEIKQRAQDYNDVVLSEIQKIIALLDAELIVPIFIDQHLTAFIVMGKKDSGKFYSEDDLAVFEILANQTALAIENAKFYDDMKLTQEQLFQAEKMATIGTMADGLSHQINNRFHALGFIAGDALDTIRLNKDELSENKMKEMLVELERSFVRVQENVIQGGEIVQGLLKYTRKGDAAFVAVDIEAVFKAALEMVQFKIKMSELKIIRDYNVATIPKIKGNFTQLQEVFFNLIDNGYDAMMQRKSEAKEPAYQPTLVVRVVKEGEFVQVSFHDNGIGVKDEDLRKLFTPFFTTKLSSKKGTGLGLYVIKKIVEDNHGGQVEMFSKYMQGTQMKLLLPIAIG